MAGQVRLMDLIWNKHSIALVLVHLCCLLRLLFALDPSGFVFIFDLLFLLSLVKQWNALKDASHGVPTKAATSCDCEVRTEASDELVLRSRTGEKADRQDESELKFSLTFVRNKESSCFGVSCCLCLPRKMCADRTVQTDEYSIAVSVIQKDLPVGSDQYIQTEDVTCSLDESAAIFPICVNQSIQTEDDVPSPLFENTVVLLSYFEQAVQASYEITDVECQSDQVCCEERSVQTEGVFHSASDCFTGLLEVPAAHNRLPLRDSSSQTDLDQIRVPIWIDQCCLVPDHRALEPPDLELEILREDMRALQAQWKDDFEMEERLKLSLQAEVNELARNNDVLAEKLGDTQGFIEDLRKRVVQLQDARTTEFAMMQKELVARSQKIEILGTGLDAAREESEKQQKELINLRAQLEATFEEKLSELKSERDQAYATLDYVEENFTKTITENEDLEKNVRYLQHEKRLKEEEVDRLNEELKRVQGEEITRLNEEIQRISQARCTLQQSAQTSFLSYSRRDGSLPGNLSAADLLKTPEYANKDANVAVEIATSPVQLQTSDAATSPLPSQDLVVEKPAAQPTTAVMDPTPSATDSGAASGDSERENVTPPPSGVLRRSKRALFSDTKQSAGGNMRKRLQFQPLGTQLSAPPALPLADLNRISRPTFLPFNSSNTVSNIALRPLPAAPVTKFVPPASQPSVKPRQGFAFSLKNSVVPNNIPVLSEEQQKAANAARQYMLQMNSAASTSRNSGYSSVPTRREFLSDRYHPNSFGLNGTSGISVSTIQLSQTNSSSKVNPFR